MIVNEGRRAMYAGLRGGGNVAITLLNVGGRYIGTVARESAGRRGTDDIEPNASNKANIIALMTGCVPLTLVTRSRLRLLRACSIPLSAKRRKEYATLRSSLRYAGWNGTLRTDRLYLK